MKRKIVAGLLLTAILVPSLMGCGTKGQTDSSDVSEITEDTEKAKDGVIALTVWGAEEDQELLNEIAEAFEKQYSSEAKIEVTVEAESESSCKDTILGDVLNAPDVFTFVDDQLLAFIASGVLEPVVDNVEQIKTVNNKAAVEAASVHDTLYAYPLTADNGYFMYYNSDFFTEEDVTSLDQMLAIAEAAGKKITMDWSSGWYLYSFFGNTGMTVGLNEDGISNYCDWNRTDGAIKGIDVAQAMLQISANAGFLNGGDEALLNGANDGSVIAGISGVWNATAIENAWGEQYRACKLPTFTCADTQVQMGSFAGYKMLGVNSYSEHSDWAAKLAEWISNEDNQTLRFEKRQQGPANINAANSSAVAQSPAIQAVIAQSEFASLQRIGGAYWSPTTELGTLLAEGNPKGSNLQEVLDATVAAITASNGQ